MTNDPTTDKVRQLAESVQALLDEHAKRMAPLLRSLEDQAPRLEALGTETCALLDRLKSALEEDMVRASERVELATEAVRRLRGEK